MDLSLSGINTPEEGDLFHERRGHLYDIKVFEKPNVLRRVAVYNSKTDKITFDNASKSIFLYYGIVNFCKENKGVDNNE